MPNADCLDPRSPAQVRRTRVIVLVCVATGLLGLVAALWMRGP